MRILSAALAALLLTACSDTPAPVAKAPEPPPSPISGRQAFQYMYGSSRIWATDSMPLTIRSLTVPDVKPENGKAGAWEVVFVSEAMAPSPHLHLVRRRNRKRPQRCVPRPTGKLARRRPQPVVFAGAAESRYHRSPDSRPSTSPDPYLNKPGQRPPVNYLLNYETATRFPNPVWRVLWGGSVSSAEYTVTVDASTGKVVAHD